MAKKTKKKAVKKSAKKASKKKPAKKASKKKAVKKAAKKTPARVKNAMGINPYLTFNGTCEAAFNFYRSVFGGNFPYIGRFKDMPPAPNQPAMPDEVANLIMHVSLPIGNSILMGSDTTPDHGTATAGTNFSISLNATSKAEADKLYNGLAAGGTATMPMAKQFWGAYFGMLTDKFGIHWMVNFDEKPM